MLFLEDVYEEIEKAGGGAPAFEAWYEDPRPKERGGGIFPIVSAFFDNKRLYCIWGKTGWGKNPRRYTSHLWCLRCGDPDGNPILTTFHPDAELVYPYDD